MFVYTGTFVFHFIFILVKTQIFTYLIINMFYTKHLHAYLLINIFFPTYMYIQNCFLELVQFSGPPPSFLLSVCQQEVVRIAPIHKKFSKRPFGRGHPQLQVLGIYQPCGYEAFTYPADPTAQPADPETPRFFCGEWEV